MWKTLILTAGSDSQNETFQKQLELIPTERYCEKVETITDESLGIRIGSGGATLSIIRKVFEEFPDPESLTKCKILLVHSGGLSQRMPHLSAYGKAFGHLPNKKTILETKLAIYKDHLLEKLPNTGGLMITASDVIENMERLKQIESNDNSDLILFSHISSVEIGSQHGVYVIDQASGRLKCVLQKPTIEEMRLKEAIMRDGMVLTDSCYFMTWKFCRRLLENSLLCKPVTQEICCYGDFLRPLGSQPEIDYIEISSTNLKPYRLALADIFKTAKPRISELGENSFFHFGTYHEFIDSLRPQSNFQKSFPESFSSNIIFSKEITPTEDSESRFIEFTSGISMKIGNNCIVSQVDAENFDTSIPNNTVVFTLALKSKKFVTVMNKIDDDIKKKSDKLIWNGHNTRIQGKSIWEAPIFRVMDTRRESLKVTLDEWTNGFNEMVR